MRRIKASLIVATYNWTEALELCLTSVLQQTVLPAEVIIADDGSDEKTLRVVQAFALRAPFPLLHEWHEDKGFRKTIILNKAIQRSSSEYIIQIDGDVILDRHFIEDHLRQAEKGCFIRGTRCILNERISRTLLENKKIPARDKISLKCGQTPNALRLPSVFVALTTRKEFSGRRVKGCNMAFWKDDLVRVNGYDNDLSGWGHEDEELSWRLVNAGIRKKIIKCTAIVYHIWHRYLPRTKEETHLYLLEEVIKNRIMRTENGLLEVCNDAKD